MQKWKSKAEKFNSNDAAFAELVEVDLSQYDGEGVDAEGNIQ